jgi:hypothetical protein
MAHVRLACPSVNLATIIDGHPDNACALISRGKPTDFGTLRRQVAGLRTGLIGLGLEPGDRVAIVSGNNRYFVVSYLAALSAGLVAVPLNPTNPGVAVRRSSTGSRRGRSSSGPQVAAFEGVDRRRAERRVRHRCRLHSRRRARSELSTDDSAPSWSDVPTTWPC